MPQAFWALEFTESYRLLYLLYILLGQIYSFDEVNCAYQVVYKSPIVTAFATIYFFLDIRKFVKPPNKSFQRKISFFFFVHKRFNFDKDL
mgnify:CR=1 FL=1